MALAVADEVSRAQAAVLSLCGRLLLQPSVSALIHARFSLSYQPVSQCVCLRVHGGAGACARGKERGCL